MITSLNKEQLCNYIKKLLDFYIPDGYMADDSIILKSIDVALMRCENCFKHVLLPGYRDDKGNAIFYHLHSDQFATFIYFLGNILWTDYNEKYLCDKILNLNRILHGFFLSYKCPMPDIFILGHPIGSVIGNAKYSDGLYVSQNVTINTHFNKNGELDLEIGKGVFLAPGAKIMGNQKIGDRVSVGVDTLIYNKRIENDSVCIKNDKGELEIRPCMHKQCKAQCLFDIEF